MCCSTGTGQDTFALSSVCVCVWERASLTQQQSSERRERDNIISHIITVLAALCPRLPDPGDNYHNVYLSLPLNDRKREGRGWTTQNREVELRIKQRLKQICAFPSENYCYIIMVQWCYQIVTLSYFDMYKVWY